MKGSRLCRMEVIWLIQNTKESWVSMIGSGPVPREEQIRGWRTQRDKDSGKRLNWDSDRSCGDRYFVILIRCRIWGQRPMRQGLCGPLRKLVSAGRGMVLGMAGLWYWRRSRRQEALALVSSWVLERWCMDKLAVTQSSSQVGPMWHEGPRRNMSDYLHCSSASVSPVGAARCMIKAGSRLCW